MPDWKEPSFFAPPEAGGLVSESEYLSLFANTGNKTAIGEASVAYLYTPEAPKKMVDLLGPDLKIIILLRNPVDMAYSLWGHQCQEGVEDLSFEDALNEEQARLQKHAGSKLRDSWIYNYAYTDRARYKKQIEYYDAVFPAHQIHIQIFEEYFIESMPLFKDTCDFLGIEQTFTPDEKIYNPGGKLRFTGIQRFLNESSPLKSVIKPLIPEDFRAGIKNSLTALNKKPAARTPLSQETREMLEKQFDADVRWLEKRLDRDLKTIWF